MDISTIMVVACVKCKHPPSFSAAPKKHNELVIIYMLVHGWPQIPSRRNNDWQSHVGLSTYHCYNHHLYDSLPSITNPNNSLLIDD